MSTKAFPAWGYVVVIIGIVVISVLSVIIFSRFCRKSLLSKFLCNNNNARTKGQIIMPNDATSNDEMECQHYDENATCVSALLKDEQQQAVDNENGVLMDSQVVYTAVSKDKANQV